MQSMIGFFRQRNSARSPCIIFMDNIQKLETQFTSTVRSKDEMIATIESQKASSNNLIDAIQEANEILLHAAATSSEPDKILAASKVLVASLAEAAKS